MAEKTGIEWCDHTWNPWYGCTKVSPACDHCYAEALMDHRFHRVTWGAPPVRASAGTLAAPLKWQRLAHAAGKPATVFCLSLGDIWDNRVPPSWRAEAFDTMRKTPDLIYLLLSKRIGNAAKMCPDGLPSNAALGATVVTQAEWDRDAPKLAAAADALGATFSFVSIEPMLEPIDLRGVDTDWVICGGESGPGARPMDPEWARDLHRQCRAANVPFFFKQMTGRAAIPADLMVREFPGE